MALTNQPYIPLYVRDWLTNNKLKMCSTSAHGLMINIMCIMHKEDEYGTISLKPNFKRDSEIRLNFASQLARLLPFDRGEIYTSLCELIDEDVLQIKDELLICDRMIRDCNTSKKNANNGGKGGKKTQQKIKDLAKATAIANFEANTANANAIENESEYANENEEVFS